MTRRSWVYIDGVAYEKGTEPMDTPTGRGPAIMGDLPDFVSPIDHTVVHGRAGMRDHCARHNVVPTADLKGLPPMTMNREYKPDRKAIREKIIETIERKGYRDA